MSDDISNAARLEIQAEEDRFRAEQFGIKSRAESAKRYEIWAEIEHKKQERDKYQKFKEHGNE